MRVPYRVAQAIVGNKLDCVFEMEPAHFRGLARKATWTNPARAVLVPWIVRTFSLKKGKNKFEKANSEWQMYAEFYTRLSSFVMYSTQHVSLWMFNYHVISVIYHVEHTEYYYAHVHPTDFINHNALYQDVANHESFCSIFLNKEGILCMSPKLSSSE
jgi:hypothetical protein